MNFEDALQKSASMLHEAKRKGLLEEFLMIGALALARHGKVRATSDIDFAIRMGSKPLHDLADFLDSEARHGDSDDPITGCINFTIGTGAAKTKIQLIQFPKAIEEAAFLDPEEQKLHGTKIPIAGWQGLFVLKLYAGGPLDIEDAQSIIDQKKPKEGEFEAVRLITSKLRLSSRLAKIKR